MIPIIVRCVSYKSFLGSCAKDECYGNYCTEMPRKISLNSVKL